MLYCRATRTVRCRHWPGFVFLVLTIACASRAVAAPFPVFNAPGFTQELYATAPGFMGGVAFAPDGDVLVDACAFSSPLRRFDSDTTTVINGTTVHPLIATLTSNAGCGLTNHPDGTLYSNIGSGINNLNADTGVEIRPGFGPASNGLGITTDPQSGDLFYVGSNGTIERVDAAFATAVTFSTVTSGNFIDGIFFDPTGDFLFLANRSIFAVTVLDRTGALVQHVSITSEPDGIAFHAVEGFVLTNNIDGTLTRLDFPANDFSQIPTQSVFASGGFRGDLSQVGPDGCLFLTQNGTRFDDNATSTDNSIVRICPSFSIPPGVGKPLDHFLCYKTKAKQPIQVALEDQFDSGSYAGKRAKLFCPPADKNGEGIFDDQTHLEGYKIKGPHAKRRRVLVNNQFGRFMFDTKKTSTLLVPTGKSLPPSAPPDPPAASSNVDHFRCIKAKTSKGTARFPKRVTAEVVDQFGARQVVLKKPNALCLPTDKNGEGIKSPKDHLLCYKIKPTPKTSAKGVQVNNQFGPGVLDLKVEAELCVPSIKDPNCGDGIDNHVLEECDGADDAACPGGCRVDCTCTPVCGDGKINQASEECDGSASSACPGACLSDCTCAVCGDGVAEAPVEQCDGGDDAACPGLCLADCSCSLCTEDPGLPIFAGGPGTSACRQFDGDQASCEMAFHVGGTCAIPASCFFDGVTQLCKGCGPTNAGAGVCVNTCTVPPVCVDASKTIFAGGPGTNACRQFDGDQASCDIAWHIGGAGQAASCFFEAATQSCKGCGPANAGAGACVNTCAVPPMCADASLTIFAGGPGTSACRQFDGDQPSCDVAWHVDQCGRAASCFYTSGAETCRGCGQNNETGGSCTNTCGP